MGQEFYAVLFRAGSSGRFVGNLVWGSIYPNRYSFTTSDYNSTHTQTPWGTTFEFIVDKSMSTWGDKNFFKKIKLLSDCAMVTAHANVNFETFFDLFPIGKIILITLKETELKEVYINTILKNGFENLEKRDLRFPEISYIFNKYKEKFGMSPTDQVIDEDTKREICKLYSELLYNNKRNTEDYWLNPKIPENHASKVLLLPYSEIVNDKDTTLKNISNFIEKDIPKNISDFYDRYIEGRNQLVEKYMT